jgi:iron complex outermembrane receptor protein
VIDAYALYTVNTATKLRFTVSNLAPRDYITTSSIIDSGQRQTVVSNGPTSTNVAMRLEMRL